MRPKILDHMNQKWPYYRQLHQILWTSMPFYLIFWVIIFDGWATDLVHSSASKIFFEPVSFISLP